MKYKLWMFLVMLVFLSLTLVSAGTYDDCTIYGNCQPVKTGTTTPTNYSTIGVNDSYYHQGLTPQQVADLFNELDPIFSNEINNICYANGTGCSTSTYNVTYNNLLNQNCPSGQVVNGTYLNGTFKCTPFLNKTYADTLYYPRNTNPLGYTNLSYWTITPTLLDLITMDGSGYNGALNVLIGATSSPYETGSYTKLFVQSQDFISTCSGEITYCDALSSSVCDLVSTCSFDAEFGCTGTVTDSSCGQIPIGACESETNGMCYITTTGGEYTHIDKAGVGQTNNAYECQDSGGTPQTTIDYTCGYLTTGTVYTNNVITSTLSATTSITSPNLSGVSAIRTPITTISNLIISKGTQQANDLILNFKTVNFTGNLSANDKNFYFDGTTHILNISGIINTQSNFSVNNQQGLTFNYTTVCFVDLVGLTKKTQNFTVVGGIIVQNTSCA